MKYNASHQNENTELDMQYNFVYQVCMNWEGEQITGRLGTL